MINWSQIIISLCTLLITGILIPLFRAKKAEIDASLSVSQRETIYYWVNVAVCWAKQYLSSASGAEKKEKVLDFVHSKLTSLGIEVEIAELDKIVEAVYLEVKSEFTEKELLTQQMSLFDSQWESPNGVNNIGII